MMKLSWGHIARITFAATLLLIIAFVYLPHLFYTYSITAIVSAPVISITSPIEGILENSPPTMGTEMKAGDVIGVVENLTLLAHHRIRELQRQQMGGKRIVDGSAAHTHCRRRNAKTAEQPPARTHGTA